jgi:hypothetical protein
MGCYINLPMKTSGAEQLVARGATIIKRPATFSGIPEGKVLVCVVQNPTFDAAGVAYDEAEFRRMLSSMGPRDHTWLLLDRSLALSLNPHIPNYETGAS